jgi:hypothetical protein
MALATAVNAMRHGVRKSYGTGEIHVKFQKQISRREIDALVYEVRESVKRGVRRDMERITWHVPGICWSIDDIIHDLHRLYSHHTQDLASKYRMTPRAGHLLCGEEVAQNFRENAQKFGAPLFLKRDCGSNLNEKHVNAVLLEMIVIQFNSPPYYPGFNGSLERLNQDIHPLVKGMNLKTVEVFEFANTLESRTERVNHQRRPCLKGLNACQAFFNGKSIAKEYHRRRRKEVHTEITDMAARIIEASGDDGDIMRATAWRVSVKNWLRMNGMITVTSGGRVSPNYSRFQTQD